MARRTLNFDTFMTEKKREPIMVTVFGKEYPVEPRIPAIVMVTLARASDTRVSEMDAAKMLLQAGDILFGKAAIDDFCRQGITNDQLVDLIKKVFEMINGNRDLDDDDVDEISDEDGMVATTNRSKK